MIHLVTGYAGTEHIKSADQGSFNAAFFGEGQFVMEIGNQFKASIINNNTIRIANGDLLMQGRHIRIEPDSYEDITIDTGTSGKNRIDLICMTYEKNASTGIETAYIEVVKGAEATGTATVPAVTTTGSILDSAIKNQMPLYAVNINGVVLASVTKKFTTCPTYKKLAEQYALQFEQACSTYLGSLNILDSTSTIKANTKSNQLAGALALKELITRIDSSNILDSVSTVKSNTKSNQLSGALALKEALTLVDTKSNALLFQSVTVLSGFGIEHGTSLTGAKSVAKTGYTPVGIVSYSIDDDYIFAQTLSLGGSMLTYTLRNTTSGMGKVLNATFKVGVLYVKS